MPEAVVRPDLKALLPRSTTAGVSGFFLGLGLIWQPGPQNIFVLTDAIKHADAPNTAGWLLGSIVASTASVCDTVLIVAALSSIGLLVRFAPTLRWKLMLAAGLYLMVLGIYNLWTLPDLGSGTNDATLVGDHIWRTLLVSIPNLHAIAEIFGVIGSAGMSFHGRDRLYFGIGTATASWLWFSTLTTIGHIAGSATKIPHQAVAIVGGSSMCFFGLVLLISAWRKRTLHPI
jgi:L-lysine exporter family protein LysE/ArgO